MLYNVIESPKGVIKRLAGNKIIFIGCLAIIRLLRQLYCRNKEIYSNIFNYTFIPFYPIAFSRKWREVLASSPY